MKSNLNITIVDWKPFTDLRTISQREDRLNAHGVSLKNNQGVLFSNTAHDRFRVVLKINKMLVLLIPPVNADRMDRCSLYLKISHWLKDTFTVAKYLEDVFEEEVRYAETCLM